MTQSQNQSSLRFFPFLIGITGGFFLLINRFTTPVLLDSQARSDVVGVILCGFLLAIGLIWQNIQSVPPDAVELIGEQGFELADHLPEPIKTELAWASHLILTNTVTGSMVIYYQNQVLLRRGILGKNKQVKVGAIVTKVLEQKKPIYLVDLKLYPGKIEFDYLPENTQGLICQPLGDQGVMILGANVPRSYTKKDENWIAGIADKLTESLRDQLIYKSS
jgi:4-amino-4-deoxy-L-arabinose transferase-like glycosyltransferase